MEFTLEPLRCGHRNVLHARTIRPYRPRRMITLGMQIQPSLFAAAIVAAGALLCLLFLRAAKFPDSGRAVIAGTVAGLLIGATVSGRVFPAQFEALFIGGVKQRTDVQYARWFAANAPAALKGMSDEARAAQRKADDEQIALKQSQLEAARWSEQRSLRVFSMIIAGLTLLCAMFGAVRAGDRRQGMVTPLSIGIWSFALPGALAYIAAVQWWQVTIAEAAMLAAAIGIGPWAIAGAIGGANGGGIGRAESRSIADDAEFGGARMMQTAGRIASTLAIALALWAAWRTRGMEGAVRLSPLVALPLAWLSELRLGRRIAESERVSSNNDQRQSPMRALILEWLIAMLAALVAIRIDLHISWTWTMLGMVVTLGLLADDGRWLGALIGAMLPGGRSGLRTMRLVMPAMAAGPTQLAVSALALQAWMLPERFALPLLAGVILIEVTAPMRRSMAGQLAEVEEEIRIDDEG